jgi:hypothetical protein
MTDRSMEVDVMGLRRLAEKATPGPWKSFSEITGDDAWNPEEQTITIGAEGVLLATYKTEYVEYPDHEQNAANAAFIAAANPQAVLALLDRIEALEKGLYEILRVHANDSKRPKAFYIADETLSNCRLEVSQ